MRKVKILLSMVLIVFLLAACGPQNKITPTQTHPESGEVFTIVTSFYPIYVSAINITKGIKGVNVINMTKPQTGCLHDYQMTPQDLVTLEKADVFVVNGAGMEAFLDDVIARQKNLKIIEASDGIDLLKDESGEPNPHVWVSVKNAAKQVNNIAQGLAKSNPENASSYLANASAYTARLENLGEQMHRELDMIENRDIITFHEAFPYFAQEFDLNIVAVVEREPGVAPTPTELEETIKIVKEAGVKALFAEPQYSSGAAETIAKETGTKVYTLDPGVTGNADETAYEGYINIMTENMRVLKQALS
ncbi:MAG TPA: zinc ABC transporter substrate-binding protein [Clostridiales bacterium]|jgi:zinc transport system substrate-binding protein|nr:zinc ABC transporter substrate-binding protein [Clostridiales bacterium]